MVRNRKNGGAQSKKKYVRQQRQKKKEAKRMTEEDIDQNFQLKQLSKKVNALTASDKGWAGFASTLGDWQAIPTLVGSSTDSTMFTHIVSDVTPIAVGTGVGDRQGSSISVRSFQIDYSVRLGATSSTSLNGESMAVRVMFVCFYTPNGQPADSAGSLVPTYQDLFALQGPGAGMTRTFLRNQYQPFSNNYHVYYDRLHEFNLITPLAVVGTPSRFPTQTMHHGRINVKPTKKNSLVTFNSTTGTIADILTNQWCLLAFSDNATAVDGGPPQIIMKGIVRFDQ